MAPKLKSKTKSTKTNTSADRKKKETGSSKKQETSSAKKSSKKQSSSSKKVSAKKSDTSKSKSNKVNAKTSKPAKKTKEELKPKTSNRKTLTTKKSGTKSESKDKKVKKTSSNRKQAETKQKTKVSTDAKKKNTKSGKSVKTVSKSKDSLQASKREKLKTMVDSKQEGGVPPTQAMIAAPTDKMLKPFRDAAKKNLEIKKNNEKMKKKGGFLAKPPKKGKKYTFDLRVHSPVSEGYFSTGGVDPASAMVRLAKSKGLDIIAVTDYNSADFVDKVKDEASDTSITVLPGIDLRCSLGSCDEVSFVALFPEEYSSKELNTILQELGIPENAKGRKSFTLREELKNIIKVVENYNGILIPTRLDKTPHRILAVKELVEKYGFHAFDLVHPENPEYFKKNWPAGEFTFMSFSNANALGQIGSRHMKLRLPTPGFDGIKVLVSRRNAQKSATK